MLGHEEDAADAAQDTLIKVLAHLDRFDRDRSFATWIFGIARNTCIDAHRRGRHRRHEPEHEAADTATLSPLQAVTRDEQAARVHRALAEIPDMYREVLILHHFEHLKYTEIAEALQVPLGTVMNRIFRARQKLRVVLGEEVAL